MTVSIIACPSCRNLLLDDTIQCPSCRHVLRPEFASRLPEIAESRESPSEEESPCGQCGEMVRHGLVRCWNCGNFMKDEIAATYQRMQESQSHVIYSAIPETELVEQPPEAERTVSGGDSDFDDFELAPEIATDEHFPGYTPDGNVNYSGTGHNQYGGDNSQDYYSLPHHDSTGDYKQPLGEAAEAAGWGEAAPTTPAPAETSPPSHYALQSPAGEVRESAASKTSAPQPAAESADAPPPVPTAAAAENAGDVPHSVATGGDVLLQVALQEEAESAKRLTRGGKRRGGTRAVRGFVVYCPMGHRVEVQEKHRGMTGRCPKCKAPFFVPQKAVDESTANEPAASDAAAGQEGAAAPQIESGKYTAWLVDVHLHTVNPAKLKLTPGSLQKDFQKVDVGFSPEGLLVATLLKAGGLFGAPAKKVTAAREAMLAHLGEGKPVDQVPVAAHQFYASETTGKLAIAQPIMYAHESMFAGVEVFGPGRIAVRLPPVEKAEPQFLSFSLSGYREFASALARFFGIDAFGEELGVPLTDQFTELKCHYNDTVLPVLDAVEYYQHDPAFKLELIGRKCEGCGLIVSEDARKKEKIGGANGKSIAKFKCPKCGKKFGTQSLFTLPKPEASAEATAGSA